MDKLYAILGTVIALALWTWGAMEYRELQVKNEWAEKNRKIERTHQAATNDIASKWHQSNLAQEKANAEKDKKIEALRRSKKDSMLADNSSSVQPDYFLYRMHNELSRCGLSESPDRQIIDNYADGADVLQYSIGEYEKVREQLQACINTIQSLPCVE